MDGSKLVDYIHPQGLKYFYPSRTSRVVPIAVLFVPSSSWQNMRNFYCLAWTVAGDSDGRGDTNTYDDYSRFARVDELVHLKHVLNNCQPGSTAL